ncbi:hypothetical protein [Microbacterium sp. Y-01]|uniref:hypothetical protein n=1 Tax=Microbacterium sp. Y-01 TaxID=2048898 RepID=UPI000F5EADC1|nr:hypothetical protein [Microbacterium sp. Y-01]
MIRRTRTRLALSAVVLLVGVALTPAAAQAAEAAEASTITTFGFVPTDSAGAAKLADVEAQRTEVESYEAAGEPAATRRNSGEMSDATPQDSSIRAASNAAYRIVSTWTDNIAKSTVARAGNGTTWGLTKVQNKHHVNLNMIQKMAVKVVVENTRMSDNKQKGLITAYCMGVTVCPQWVVNVAG